MEMWPTHGPHPHDHHWSGGRLVRRPRRPSRRGRPAPWPGRGRCGMAPPGCAVRDLPPERAQMARIFSCYLPLPVIVASTPAVADDPGAPRRHGQPGAVLHHGGFLPCPRGPPDVSPGLPCPGTLRGGTGRVNAETHMLWADPAAPAPVLGQRASAYAAAMPAGVFGPDDRVHADQDLRQARRAVPQAAGQLPARPRRAPGSVPCSRLTQPGPARCSKSDDCYVHHFLSWMNVTFISNGDPWPHAHRIGDAVQT